MGSDGSSDGYVTHGQERPQWGDAGQREAGQSGVDGTFHRATRNGAPSVKVTNYLVQEFSIERFQTMGDRG